MAPTLTTHTNHHSLWNHSNPLKKQKVIVALQQHKSTRSHYMHIIGLRYSNSENFLSNIVINFLCSFKYYFCTYSREPVRLATLIDSVVKIIMHRKTVSILFLILFHSYFMHIFDVANFTCFLPPLAKIIIILVKH